VPTAVLFEELDKVELAIGGKVQIVQPDADKLNARNFLSSHHFGSGLLILGLARLKKII